MQKVEGSNPFIRSISVPSRGDVAEWLGTGLQNPLHRFKSGRRLLMMACSLQRAPTDGSVAILRIHVQHLLCPHTLAGPQEHDSEE